MVTTGPSHVASSRDESPSLSLTEFGQAFYEETLSLPAAVQPDRFFFRQYLAVLEKQYGFDLKLLAPKLGSPGMLESLWSVHHVASILFDDGKHTENRSKIRVAASLHAAIKRLLGVLDLDGRSA